MNFWYMIKIGIGIVLVAVILVLIGQFLLQWYISDRVDKSLAAEDRDAPDVVLEPLLDMARDSDDDTDEEPPTTIPIDPGDELETGYVSD